MTRKLKGLGVAMIAVFAIVGTGASAASAAEFHREQTNTKLKSAQMTEITFGFLGMNVKCHTDTGTANASAILATPTISLTPATSCNYFGGKMIWNYNGCTKVFAADSTTKATASIVCPPGKEIDVSGPGECHVYIPAQTPKVPTVKLTNVGSGMTRAVWMRWETTGITYTPTMNCYGIGVHHDGKLSGEFKVSGTNFPETSNMGFWVE